MFRTFNCGIGMVVIVDKNDAAAALKQLAAAGETVWAIGTIQARIGNEVQTQVGSGSVQKKGTIPFVARFAKKAQLHMKYEEIETLEKYLSSVEVALLRDDARSLIAYPKESVSPWNTKQLDTANQQILDDVSGSANIYAIFTAPKESSTFSLKYIGKTTRKLARQRVRNHLIKKNKQTGSKLERIMAHVQSGGLVKISWLKIEPESLRNYVEEELINRHKEADWNRENATKG